MSVDLHPKSEEFIREVFRRYSSSNLNSSIISGNLILHMYAEKDTRDTSGELDGYYDALLFRLDIYDTEALLKYSIGCRDEINIGSDISVRVRIFKDGSTMIFSSERMKLYLSQSINLVLETTNV